MGILDELRNRARHILGPLLGIVTVAYFVYHTVHGERGVLAYLQLREQVSAASENLAELKTEKQHWERRVHLLHPASLDRDMLDERVRLMLGYARADDLVILTSKKHTPTEEEERRTQ